MSDNVLRITALAILTESERLSRKAGSFLGQCVADPAPLTDKQADWFEQLAERAGIEWEGSRHG